MADPKEELVRQWLIKANHDLASARKLANVPNPYLDSAIFHCQQAAEKAIKAFLVYHDQRFDKTQDLEILLDLATKFESQFSQHLETAAQLTPYAVTFRYPGNDIEPEPEEFADALKVAEKIYQFVLSNLPATVQPWSNTFPLTPSCCTGHRWWETPLLLPNGSMLSPRGAGYQSNAVRLSQDCSTDPYLGPRG